MNRLLVFLSWYSGGRTGACASVDTGMCLCRYCLGTNVSVVAACCRNACIRLVVDRVVQTAAAVID